MAPSVVGETSEIEPAFTAPSQQSAIPLVEETPSAEPEVEEMPIAPGRPVFDLTEPLGEPETETPESPDVKSEGGDDPYIAELRQLAGFDLESSDDESQTPGPSDEQEGDEEPPLQK
jgi:hypothetical protein